MCQYFTSRCPNALCRAPQCHASRCHIGKSSGRLCPQNPETPLLPLPEDAPELECRDCGHVGRVRSTGGGQSQGQGCDKGRGRGGRSGQVTMQSPPPLPLSPSSALASQERAAGLRERGFQDPGPPVFPFQQQQQRPFSPPLLQPLPHSQRPVSSTPQHLRHHRSPPPQHPHQQSAPGPPPPPLFPTSEPHQIFSFAPPPWDPFWLSPRDRLPPALGEVLGRYGMERKEVFAQAEVGDKGVWWGKKDGERFWEKGGAESGGKRKEKRGVGDRGGDRGVGDRDGDGGVEDAGVIEGESEEETVTDEDATVVGDEGLEDGNGGAVEEEQNGKMRGDGGQTMGDKRGAAESDWHEKLEQAWLKLRRELEVIKRGGT